MAGSKKTAKALTPEEKLKQALVPENEQPYPVPANWCWTRVGNVSSIYRGVSYKKNDVHLIKEDSDCLILRGGNIGEGCIDIGEDNVYVNKSLVNENQFVRQNDIVIVASTGSTKVIGRAGVSTKDYLDVSFGAFLMLIRPTNKFSPRYLAYFFQSDEYRNRIRSLVGGVNINNIKADYITGTPFPLPPLAEQQRIVRRSESLFARLDEAKEKAQAAVDSFELRRSAILHKAFTGELTKKWRRKHGVETGSWKEFYFDECIEKMQNGLAKRKGMEGENRVVLRLANLLDDGFDTTELREILLDDREKQAYTLHKNDVVMVRVNGSKDNVGKQLLITEDNGWSFCDHIIRICYKKHFVLPQYMVYFSKDRNYRFYVKENMVSSAGQNTISRKGMAGLKVMVPSLAEQNEIVRILDNILTQEQKAKEASEAVLARIDAMKKAVLARAFRGRLGTNDPEEESAAALLLEKET